MERRQRDGSGDAYGASNTTALDRKFTELPSLGQGGTQGHRRGTSLGVLRRMKRLGNLARDLWHLLAHWTRKLSSEQYSYPERPGVLLDPSLSPLVPSQSCPCRDMAVPAIEPTPGTLTCPCAAPLPHGVHQFARRILEGTAPGVACP